MTRSLVLPIVVALVLVTSSAPAFAEGFIDFYVGSAMTRDSNVTVRIPGFSESERVDWDTSITAGARFGFWFDRLDWLGLALDGSFFRPDKDLTVYPVSLLLMLRVPLLRDDSVPRGRLQPYIAAGPALFVSHLEYDAAGRLIATTDAGGRARRTQYAGWDETRIDPLGQTYGNPPLDTASKVFDPGEHRSTRIVADHVIFAAPTRTSKFVLAAAAQRPVLDQFQYAPWMVANLTMKDFPITRSGAPIAWDNVIYGSDSLGYVVATHQTLRTHLSETVFTYYYPMTGSSPAQERDRLLETDWRTWAKFILKDLAKPHPEISSLVAHLDIFRWGHAMVRPRPGFVWGEARRQAAEPQPGVFFAHSDLSGFSLFEEAQYRGVLAAERILTKHRISFSSSL